jgi:hypothetical protein
MRALLLLLLLLLAAAWAARCTRAQPVPDSYPATGVARRAKKKDLKVGVGAANPKRIDPAECFLSNNMFRENLALLRADPNLRHKKSPVTPTLIASEEGFCDLLHSKSTAGEKTFEDAGLFSDWCATASGPLCTRECFALANLFDLSQQVPRALEIDDCVGCLVDDDCSAKALTDSAFHPGQGVLTVEPVDTHVDRVFVSDLVDAKTFPDGGALPNVDTLQRRSSWATQTFLRKDSREYPKKLL